MSNGEGVPYIDGVEPYQESSEEAETQLPGVPTIRFESAYFASFVTADEEDIPESFSGDSGYVGNIDHHHTYRIIG